MKNVVPLFAIVVALNSFGEISWEGFGSDYTFGTAGIPLQTGTLMVPEAGKEVKSLSFFPALDAVIKVTGGALNFQTDGGISVAECGAVEISAPVSTAGDLSISGGMVVTDGLSLFDGTPVTVFEGADVSQIDVVSAKIESYGSVSTAHPCNVKMEGGEKTVQLQFVNGDWLKCMKIRLANSGGNVVAKVAYRRYTKIVRHPVGLDMDTVAVGSVNTDKDKAFNYASVKECSIKSLTLRRNVGAHGVAFMGAVASTAMDIGADANVRLFGGTSTGSDGETNSTGIVLNGRLSITNPNRTVISGAVSGSGVLSLESWDGASEEKEIKLGEENENAGILINQSSSTTVLARGAAVSSITEVSDVWIKRAPNATAVKAKVCQFVHNGDKIEFQAQIYDGGWVKCAVIKLNNSGDNIAGSIVSTPYYKVASKEEGEAFIGTDFYSVKDSWGGDRGNYHVVAMTLHTYGLTVRRETVLSSASMQNGGRIEVGSGTRLVLDVADCMPSNGVVIVRGGGELEPRAVQTASKEQFTSIYVQPGGALRLKHNDAFAHRGAWIYVDGGDLALKRGVAGVNHDSGLYLNRVVLAGGAWASGLRARIGSNITSFVPEWHIKKGTSGEPVTVNCGFTFVGVASLQTFTVSVDDFAEGADLITCPGASSIEGDGAFAEFNSNLAYRIPVCKQGAGSWLVNAASPNYHAKVIIENGEMIMGVNDAFPAAELISLNGGRLTLANETSQTFTKLTVTKPSSLVLGNRTSAFFKDVDTGDFGGRLTITGDFSHGSPLRIGESAVLSAQQLGNIRINGRRAIQDERGYLYPYYPGPAIIVR